MEKERIIEIISSYFQKLGLSSELYENFFCVSELKELFVMKLANANVVIGNKSDASSHQTHIAITGEAIDFFCESNIFNQLSTESIEMVKISVLRQNVDELQGKNIDTSEMDYIFEKCDVSFGKRTQNQLQLSKRIAANSDLFNNLRNGLRENDLLVFWKNKKTEDIYVVGINKEFYSLYIDDYSQIFNSTTLIKFGEQDDELDDNNSTSRMKLKIYAEKATDSGTCYLCGCTLSEYMNHIPATYKENAIQRGIVKNAYLDRLVKTIIRNENIPTITLIGERICVSEGGKELELSQYRILDGLQRTFRIHEIWRSMKVFEKIENKDEILSMNKMKLARYVSSLEEKCDLNIFKEIVDEYKVNGDLNRFKKSFERNEQWFEVWEELTLEQETEKMLILNAGHKQMDYRHQLELLFLNILPKLNELFKNDEEIKIIRNKEKTDMQYSKTRKRGEFYFSHIISSFISYSKREPITTNAELISRLQQDKYYSDEIISYSLIKQIMLFLIEFDKQLDISFGDLGSKWIAKETVLVGIFAAAGIFEEEENGGKSFAELLSNVSKLNLREYDDAKQNNIDVSKVNMGNVTKIAVKNAVLDLLSGKVETIEWNKYFGR